MIPGPPPDFEPPPWLRLLRKHIWLVAGLFGVLTLTAIRPFLRHVPDPPPVLFQLPEYRMVDQDGREFTPETLRGKVWVAGFVFTSCPSTCPAVTRAMADLRERFDRTDIDVMMVSFTVDPEHDTPAVLAEYADSVGADHERWRFVTGDVASVRALVKDGFKLGIGEPEPTRGNADLYDIAHSTKLALVDGNGAVRGYYGIEPDQGLDEIYHRAQHVIAEARTRQR
jgi:protein SCO1/2